MLISRATAAGGELDDGGSVVVRVVLGVVVLVVDRVVVVPWPPDCGLSSFLVAAQMPMAMITTTRTTAATSGDDRPGIAAARGHGVPRASGR